MISWWYSGLLLFPLMIIGYIQLTGGTEAAHQVTFQVADAAGPVTGARFVAGSVIATTDASGSVVLDVGSIGDDPVTVESDGYLPLQVTVPLTQSGDVSLTLQPSSVSGTVLDSVTGQPVVGVIVTVVGSEQTTATDSTGSYELAGIPRGTTLSFTGDGYSPLEAAVGDRPTVDTRLVFSRVTGTVLDGEGQPIGNALVQGGEATAVTRNDGTFTLDGADRVSEVRISASGFDDVRLPVDATRLVSAQMERVTIRASYLNQFGLGDDDALDRMIEIINSTELNAVVLDIKQDTIYFESRVKFFTDVPGMIVDVYDPAALVQRLHDEGIYVIARMVIFQDPLVAEHYPEYAVRNENTGESWRDPNGVAWVNAFNEPLWDANIALALEAVGMGFDEIQYDYVRFPSDGDLTVADFGPDYSQEAREGAITGFIERSSEAIRPTGAKLALDVFGIIALYDNDQGIGQRLTRLAPLADYLCLMIYPSHFEEGNIASAPGAPNDYPAETIAESLERAAELVPKSVDKFRPWLQDFTQPLDGFREYGPEEVRAQIDAADAFGGNGWMLWNPNNEPSVGALKPDDSSPSEVFQAVSGRPANSEDHPQAM